MDLKEKATKIAGDILPHLKKGKEKADFGFDVAEKFVTQTILRQKETDIDGLLDRLADELWAKWKRWKNDLPGKARRSGV